MEMPTKTKLSEASSDCTAILACLGPIAVFTSDAHRMALDGNLISTRMKSSGVEAAGFGGELLADAAAALKSAREKLDALMQEFGDFFNDRDACSFDVQDLTEPVYEMLWQRRDGQVIEE